MEENRNGSSPPTSHKRGLFQEIPKWVWLVGGAGIVLILVLRLRSSSSAPNPTLTTPVDTTATTTPVDTSGSAGGGTVPGGAGAGIIISDPNATAEAALLSSLATNQTGLAALIAELQQDFLQTPFHNTIHPIPVPPTPVGTPPTPMHTGQWFESSPTLGNIPIDPSTTVTEKGASIYYVPAPTLGPSPEPTPVGHPLPVSAPGYPSSSIHAGIGARPGAGMPQPPKAPPPPTSAVRKPV